jgi:hypothetical protein
VLASYLLSNLNASGTTLVCTQCYGFGGANYSWWPEDGAKVGKPKGLPVKVIAAHFCCILCTCVCIPLLTHCSCTVLNPEVHAGGIWGLVPKV